MVAGLVSMFLHRSNRMVEVNISLKACSEETGARARVCVCVGGGGREVVGGSSLWRNVMYQANVCQFTTRAFRP